MKKPAPHLADEHMNLYEWCGGVASFGLPVETRRPRRWHASYGALAVLTSLLVLNGCDRQGPLDQTGDQVGQPADTAPPPPSTPSPSDNNMNANPAMPPAGESSEPPPGEPMQKP